MKHKLVLLERRAIRIVEELAGQAMITSMPDQEGYVTIEIDIRHSADLLFFFHAGMECGKDFEREWRAERKAA